MRSNAELLKTVWARLDRPGSACPDVELGHVLNVLANVLIEGSFGDHGLGPVAKWVVCYLTIADGATLIDLQLSYAERVPQYYADRRLNEYGSPEGRPYEDIEAEELVLQAEAGAAVKKLLAAGVLVEQGEGLQHTLRIK